MISFSNLNNDDPEILTFDVENCSSSFVNAIRRTIITDVTTISFNVDDYQNSDLTVIKNTTSLHNEFILHRLGLVPIFTDNLSTYNPDTYKFILNKTNNTQNIINITTNDIEILNLETNQKEDNEKFFPRNKITGEHILLLKLKPNPSGEGQSIHIEGKSSKGTGKQHIRYSPVSNVLFINKKNTDLVNAEFSKFVDNLESDRGTKFSDNELKKLANVFNIEQAERLFHTDENNDPNKFEFTIETIGVLTPKQILASSMRVLEDKLQFIIIELEKELSSQKSLIKIKESECVMKAFDIIIKNESHTIGNLLQSYINRLFIDKNIFVGYMNPHPLQNEIFLRIKADDINVIKDVINTTCTHLIETFKNLRQQILPNDSESKPNNNNNASNKKTKFKVKK